MAQHIILNLEAPLMSFGGETIDNLGVIRPFPARSMLTGLLANALGWRRVERQRHQDLQDRIVFAARIDREPHGGLRMTDYQTVQMGDTVDLFVRSGGWVVGWTTRGEPEQRAGALGASGSGPFTHQRWRDYHADMSVTVALRLDPADGDPALDDLANALQEPARPLFIGRKPCLPSRPVFGGFIEGASALEALLSLPVEAADQGRREPPPVRLLWPEGEDAHDMTGVRLSRRSMLTDERNWVSGLHGGARPVCEGTALRERFAPIQPQEDGQP